MQVSSIQYDSVKFFVLRTKQGIREEECMGRMICFWPAVVVLAFPQVQYWRDRWCFLPHRHILSAAWACSLLLQSVQQSGLRLLFEHRYRQMLRWGSWSPFWHQFSYLINGWSFQWRDNLFGDPWYNCCLHNIPLRYIQRYPSLRSADGDFMKLLERKCSGIWANCFGKITPVHSKFVRHLLPCCSTLFFNFIMASLLFYLYELCLKLQYNTS